MWLETRSKEEIRRPNTGAITGFTVSVLFLLGREIVGVNYGRVSEVVEWGCLMKTLTTVKIKHYTCFPCFKFSRSPMITFY